MRRHPLTVVAVLACVLASVRAAPQGQPAQPAAPPAGQQPPTFKVEVNYVEIDAVVTDAQGRFVGDLSKDDFQVLEEGKPQTVTVFTRVDIPVEPADPPLFKASAVEPDVRSNLEPFNGRVFLLVLDDLQTPPQRTAYVVAAARQFVRRYVGANDLVAIVTTAGNAKASQEFTTSRARMLAALDKL